MKLKEITILYDSLSNSYKLQTRSIGNKDLIDFEVYSRDFIVPAGATGLLVTKNSIFKMVVVANMDTQYFNIKKMSPYDCNTCLKQIAKISSCLAKPK